MVPTRSYVASRIRASANEDVPATFLLEDIQFKRHPHGPAAYKGVAKGETSTMNSTQTLAWTDLCRN